ncbi:MAG: tryptophan synthase subunit alpha [Oscillospiraceae bacterium]
MNRIDRKFVELKTQNKKALITFATAGDPSLDLTEKLVLQMEQSGADIVEIGIPFSDPAAEPPVIQQASLRSLANGITLIKILEMIKNLRQKTEIPLVLMMYINTIFRFGTKRFFDLCVSCGIDGVIVPDMPFEEKAEIEREVKRTGVFSISMVAPTSHARIQMIAENGSGFLYAVPSEGAKNAFSANPKVFFQEVKAHTNVPVIVGFGADSFSQIRLQKEYGDGIIVDTAIMKEIEKLGEDCLSAVGNKIVAFRNALDE